jgi:hypothetical protein
MMALIQYCGWPIQKLVGRCTAGNLEIAFAKKH